MSNCPEKNIFTNGPHTTTSTQVSSTDGPTAHPPLVAKGAAVYPVKK